jgi:hypothetical protein
MKLSISKGVLCAHPHLLSLIVQTFPSAGPIASITRSIFSLKSILFNINHARVSRMTVVAPRTVQRSINRELQADASKKQFIHRRTKYMTNVALNHLSRGGHRE